MMLYRYRTTFVLIISSFIIVLFIYLRINESSSKQKIISIGTHKYIVEIAGDEKSRLQGLSGRMSMDKNHGMLFIFDQTSYRYFWMKEMNFPLDFVWISNNTIVDITQNVPKPISSDESNLTSFTAKYPFDKVVELNAGTVKSNNIRIGDKIKI